MRLLIYLIFYFAGSQCLLAQVPVMVHDLPFREMQYLIFIDLKSNQKEDLKSTIEQIAGFHGINKCTKYKSKGIQVLTVDPLIDPNVTNLFKIEKILEENKFNVIKVKQKIIVPKTKKNPKVKHQNTETDYPNDEEPSE